MQNPKIIIENGVAKKIPQKLRGHWKQCAIIADVHLKKLGEQMLSAMRSKGLTCNLVIVPAGERTKSLSFVEKIAKTLVGIGLKRDGCLIALGGGVIGDTVGFLASIYMRGIPFVAVPTTLLAMGDSSIGGKTGVDLAEGKNLLGAFYNPEIVFMDPMLLSTLPQREFAAGLAEIVKHAVIADCAFFEFLRKNSSAILARKPAALKKIIAKSVEIKMKIVGKDERESVKKIGSGSRMLLNYGHTVGHALEKLSNYKMPHGEAVAIGMVAENRVAVGKNLLKEEDAKKIETLLKTFHLPVKIPPQYTSADIKREFYRDKKNIDKKLYFPLPIKIGKAKIIAI